MKTSTIVLISLVATGLLLAFIFPASLMLLSRGGKAPLLAGAPNITQTTQPFSNLAVERTDTASLYLSLKLIIEDSDSIQSPVITAEGGWGEWLSLQHNGDTLQMLISVPNDTEGYNPNFCEITALVTVPSGSLNSVTMDRIGTDLKFNNLSTNALAINGTSTLNFNNCNIGLLAIPAVNLPGIKLDATHIGELKTSLHSSSSALSFTNGASVDTLNLTVCNGRNQLNLEAPAISKLNLLPGNPSGTINLNGLTPGITLASN